MSETFFENPLYVYLALGFCELVLAVIWHERRAKTWGLAMLVPPVLAAVVALVAHLVVTDREQILRAARDIAQAVETNQLERIPAHLDDDFISNVPRMRLTKADVLAAFRTETKKHAIRGVKFGRTTVEIAGREAEMHTVTVIIYGEKGEGRLWMIWDVLGFKRAGGWKILEVRQLRQGIEL